MVWRGWERDPKADRASSEVLAAYQAAVSARLPSVDCYRAGLKRGVGCTRSKSLPTLRNRQWP